MPRSYRHIQQYEKEILEMKAKGLTRKEIGDKLGFTAEQIHEFTKRYNRKQKKISEGIPLKQKGRPLKGKTALPPSIQKLSKLTQLQYEIASKDRYIKRLEMENELMRDFLSFTERK
jgi:transcriptional regulator with XRE-family HTH domain